MVGLSGVLGSVLRFGDGFVPAFVLTFLIEAVGYAVAFAARGWLDRARTGSIGLSQVLLLVLGVNLLTHPLLWLTGLSLPVDWVLAAEVVVVGVEGLAIAIVLRRPCGWPLLAALGSNAASLLAGLLIMPVLLSAIG